jgi:CheY-like chemotaxis protein
VALIIEDDARFAAVLRDLSREQGFKAVVCLRGDTGLEMAKSLKPDAIFLDLELPGLHGEKVLEELQAHPALRRIPVEVISAHERGRQVLNQGAFAFAQKPVSPEVLQDALRRLVGFLEQGSRRLLVVEDNVLEREEMQRLLSSHDVVITSVGSGAEAIEELKKHEFNCMILDLMLPDMSGMELLEKIHGELGIRDLPVVVYTAKELNEEEERRLRKEAHTVVMKGPAALQRLKDEAVLFLHRVVERLPSEKRPMVRQAQNAGSPLKGRKILVVDDDVRNVFALTALLEEHEMTVTHADNGKTSLDMLRANKDTDLVLMDIMMPIMDGYEAMRQIRQDPALSKLPVIALTAKAMMGDRDKCLAAGASDYLAKPVDADKLLSLMRVWLYRH